VSEREIVQSGVKAIGGEFARADDLFARIRRLAAEQTTPSAFAGEAFRLIAREWPSPYALIRARVGTRAIEDHWHSGPTDPAFWKPTVEQAIDTAIARAKASANFYRSRFGSESVVVIAAPLPDPSGDVSGAIGLVIACPTEARGHELLAQVRAVAAMLPPLGATIARDGARQGEIARSGGAAIQALAVASGSRGRAQLAITIANQLRSRIGCDQVVLARVDGRHLRPLAFSGFAEVSERSPGVVVALTAMCEALDLGRPVTWSTADTDHDHVLHRRWSAACDNAAVATIPLQAGGKVTALLGLRHGPGRRFTADELGKIGETAASYAAALELVHRATRTLPGHVQDSLRDLVVQARRPRGALRVVATAAFVAAVLWFVFGSVQDRASVRGRLGSLASVHIAAPFDGRLLSAPVAAGDSVKAGDLIVAFDTAELELERARLRAAVERSRIEADTARSRGREAEAMLIDARAGVDRAALAGVDRRIAAATIRAPSDGTIVSGDVRRMLGSSVPLGHALFEFAPDGSLRLELAVTDRDVARVQVGARGEFVPLARPDLRIPIVVERLRPSSEIRDGENVFVAEATLPESETWLRPGGEGFAKLDAGTSSPWRAYLRRLIDAVRVRLWV
jgi:hypothetical protein